MYDVIEQLKKAFASRDERKFAKLIVECNTFLDVFQLTCQCAKLAVNASFFERSKLENMTELALNQVIGVVTQSILDLLTPNLINWDVGKDADQLARCFIELKNEDMFNALTNECNNFRFIFEMIIECANRARNASVLQRNTFKNMMVCGFKKMMQLVSYEHEYVEGNDARRLVACLHVIEKYIPSSRRADLLGLYYLPAINYSKTLGYFLLFSCSQVIASDAFPNTRAFLADPTRRGMQTLILKNAFTSALKTKKIGKYFNLVNAFIKMNIVEKDYILETHGELIDALFDYYRGAEYALLILLSRKRLHPAFVKDVREDIIKKISWFFRALKHSNINLSGISTNRVTLNSEFSFACTSLNANLAFLLSFLSSIKGVDITQSIDTDLNRLLYNAGYAGNTEIVRLLLKKGADVNWVADSGTSCIFVAASSGHADVVRVFLEYGADVHKPARNNGKTPLLIATMKGYAEVVKMLLNSGAKITPQIKDAAKKNDDISELLRKTEKARTQRRHAATILIGISVGKFKRGIFASKPVSQVPATVMESMGKRIFLG